MTLKDRLVRGFPNENVQKKLLTGKEINYEKALETAVAMETAARNAIETLICKCHICTTTNREKMLQV